ncbi:hypothetical protein V6Z11_A06G046600 [Gossypium hirsutum]
MATIHSTDFDSVESSGSVFTANRIINSFPKHEVVKLNEGAFVQLKQVQLIVASYDLTGFLDGTLSAPMRFVQAPDGALVANPFASIFNQQDNLLTSWLLSMISPSFLSSFTNV